MKRIIVLIITIFTINITNAQWQQVGTEYITVNALAVNVITIFAGTSANGIFSSTNNGDSWTYLNNGYANSAILSLASIGTNIFAGFSGGGVFISTNNGASWAPVNNGLSDLYISSLIVNDTNLIAGTEHGIFLSTDKGNSWISLGLTSNFIYSLAVSGNNILCGAYNSGVFLSTDNGTTWNAVNTGLTDNMVYSLAINGNYIFAGTQYGGVFLSLNNGSSWTTASIGIPYGSIYSLTIKDNNIFAGTTNGVFLSTNNGITWDNINSGLPTQRQVNCFAFDNVYAYISDNGLGVWRRPLSDFAGIKENTINDNVSIYPNPAKDILTIETNTNTQQRLEITNLIGQTVYTNNINNKKATINTSAFANGVYILKLSSDKETVVRKFVKE